MQSLTHHHTYYALAKYLWIFRAFVTAILLIFSSTICHSQDKEIDRNRSTGIVDSKESEHVEFLRDKKKALEEPEKVLSALDELATIAEVGKISSSDTVRVLLEYLEVSRLSLRPVERSNSDIVVRTPRVPPESSFPAVVVLHRIGKAAHPYLIEIIEQNPSESVQTNNAIFLIMQNYPEDWNKASEYLQSCLPSAKTDEGKRRLIIASEKILQKVNRIRSIDKR